MNNNYTSEKQTFLDLITKYRIEIPIIQRDYAQGRDGKENVRDNLLSALLDIKNDKKLELDFVYGSIKNDVLQPLDGQQRLTTLFLLYLFIASKEGKLTDELRSRLGKFTYETRTSAREFCIELVKHGIYYDTLMETDYYNDEKSAAKNNALSKSIINSSWFFLSWKRDPTIKSMLTMLDAIHHKFIDQPDIWEKLSNISFHYIELQNFGLSDDLYIKMNARGKPLTAFENFRARFEQYVKYKGWEINENPTDTFSHRIDGVWADLFWHQRNKENIFDEKLLNFFRVLGLMNYTLKADKEAEDFKENIELFRSARSITFEKYLALGCFDYDYFKFLKTILNKISCSNGLRRYLDVSTYIDEEKVFSGIIANNPSYADLVIAFAYYQYLVSEVEVEREKLDSWLRIIRNLVEGSRTYLFNDAKEFADALRSVNGLVQYRNIITSYFAGDAKLELSGFLSVQILEERTKARLIEDSEEWKNEIFEIEKHPYFKGQIKFILDWSKDANNIFSIGKFREYAKKAKAVFDEKGLKHFGDYLFERALLATGDYLLEKGKNFSFLVDNDREISWKRLLRDDNEKRNHLKSLLTMVKSDGLEEQLEKIISDFSDFNDWRFHFVKNPAIIKVCGSQRLIRRNRSNEIDILLLASSSTNGYHREYFTYSLFLEIQKIRLLPDHMYKPQKSVYTPKYFDVNGRLVSFNTSTGKYYWTQNQDWTECIEFDDMERALREITQWA